MMEYLPADQHIDYLTPVPNVFQVQHFGVPDVDRESWTLRVGGLVNRELEIAVADLVKLPLREVTAFHECAGSPIHPHIPQRRVANIKWTGVPLGVLLDEAGVDKKARYVLSRGADGGTWQHMRHSAYEKDLPLSKARSPSVLLAVAMNDAALPIDHGGPVRLVVPGFYGTNSTKWLRSISLSPMRSTGAFTTKYYTDREMVGGVLRETPVWGVAPNSIIVSPGSELAVPGRPIEIWGWCWGEHPISSLEVSTDDGQSWTRAELTTREDFSWQRFGLSWSPVAVGEYHIASRATDSQGNVQPDASRRNRVYKRIVHVRNDRR